MFFGDTDCRYLKKAARLLAFSFVLKPFIFLLCAFCLIYQSHKKTVFEHYVVEHAIPVCHEAPVFMMIGVTPQGLVFSGINVKAVMVSVLLHFQCDDPSMCPLLNLPSPT